MKIAFYTIDLYKGREHLMPWRTVLEISIRLLHGGHDVCVLNGCTTNSFFEEIAEWNGVKIISIRQGYHALSDKAKSIRPEILYIQTTWREGLKDLTSLRDVVSKKIVYFSGGVYDVKSAFLFAKEWGIKAAMPYMLESIVPKCILAKKMQNLDVDTAIGLTPYTTYCCEKAGFVKSICVQTGKDDFEDINVDESIIKKYNLKGKKWMLFSGAPAPTRGACELLKAIDKTQENGLRVVMLMRTDVNSDYKFFNDIYEGMCQKEKVVLIREKISRPQLRAFFCEAYFGLLPFLVIPSEIPVTFLEMMSCGTPIITFKNGGTTSLLKDGLLISGKSVNAFSATLDEAWRSETVRKKKSEMALAMMMDYPNWDDVTKRWLQAAL